MVNKIDFNEIEKILGREGSYSKIIKDYEFRQEQMELCEKITDALNNDKILLAEAGTGVGKSMAYLIPAIKTAITNGPVIISTNTINLQSQLMDKDIPDAALALNEEFNTMVVKGRGNYVCLSMVDDANNNLFLSGSREFTKLKKWLKKTKTGDFQDLNFPFPEWYEVASNTHTCRREECPYKKNNQCFYYKMQQKIFDADVLITNHSLFFSDLNAKSVDPYGGILPHEYSAVIFDEAHHIEDNVGKVFGAEFNSFNIPLLIKRIKNRGDFGINPDLLKELGKLNDTLFENISGNFNNDYFLDEIYNLLGKDKVVEQAKKINSVLEAIIEDLEDVKRGVEKEEKQVIDRYIDMAEEIESAISMIFFNDIEENNNFSWGETRPKDKYANCSLHSTPIDVAELLQDYLFSLGIPIIMTSATLSTSNNSNAFDYIKTRLGLTEDEDLETINLGAPFDYMKNAYLYVPKDLPAPNSSPEYIDKISEIISELIDIVKGNAFVLFTSYKALLAVYNKLVINPKYTLLKQGDMSNEELIKQFKENDNTVLFGVSSFWEGIDVKGDKLSMVIIDKIPFPVPSSPLVKSKCDFIDNNKGNSFMEYSVPNACIKLKQGFGRLIRTKNDRGVVAILDSRIHTKRYKVQILNSIPRCKGTTKIEKVKEFFNK